MPSHGTPLSATHLAPFVSTATKALILVANDLGQGVQESWANRSEEMQSLFRQAFLPPQQTGQPLMARYIVPIPNIAVNYDRKFVDAAMAGGPQTPSNYDVLKVGDLYVARHKGIVRRNITIVNFGLDVSSEQAQEFGQAHKLGRTLDPWECFSIGEHRPMLNRELGFDYMAVVSLEKCEFGGGSRVCVCWWRGQERKAALYWFASVWDDYCWFGFVRES